MAKRLLLLLVVHVTAMMVSQKNVNVFIGEQSNGKSSLLKITSS